MAVLFDDRSYHGAHFTDKETEAQGLDNLPKDLQLVRSQPRTGDLRICTPYCCALGDGRRRRSWNWVQIETASLLVGERWERVGPGRQVGTLNWDLNLVSISHMGSLLLSL